MSAAIPKLNFPPPVREVIERAALAADLSVAAMIQGPKTFRAVNAKRSCARALRAKGYSLNEIGFFLNRHHTTVLHLLNTKAKNTKAPSGRAANLSRSPCPDLSGEWAI